MVSSFISAEQDRLIKLIRQIQNVGEVAPAYCWLTESSSTKGLKTYTYVVLVTQQPNCKPTSRSLGRPGSRNHQYWQQAISRRDAITELEQQLAMLQTFAERQTRTWEGLRIHELVGVRESSL